jgi:hypothetical protein
MASFGWGTTGNLPQWAASNHSFVFAASGDGGTNIDYRAYRVGGGAPTSPTTGFYPAGTKDGVVLGNPPDDSRNANDPYYASLGGETAPAAQIAAYPNQTGTTAVGTFGMAWRDVVIEKAGDTVSWTVDGLLIASVPFEDEVPSGDNIFFGMFDINAGASDDPNDFLNAAIYDNIVVVVPEPASASLLILPALWAFARRRPKTLL